MKRLIVITLAVALTAGAAVLGIVVGRASATSQHAIVQQYEAARSYQQVSTDLASTDALTREAALWYQLGSLRYGTNLLAQGQNENARTRETVVLYVRISELATERGEAERARGMLHRAEALCARTNLGQCSSADLIGFVKRLNEATSTPRK
jgi:hypothetical protein